VDCKPELMKGASGVTLGRKSISFPGERAVKERGRSWIPNKREGELPAKGETTPEKEVLPTKSVRKERKGAGFSP